jgi:hypothetical protein
MNFAATSRSPRRSNRAMTSPINARCTPSGLTNTRDLSTFTSSSHEIVRAGFYHIAQIDFLSR